MYIQVEKNNSRKNDSTIQRLFINSRSNRVMNQYQVPIGARDYIAFANLPHIGGATGYNWNGQPVWHITEGRRENHRTVFFTFNPNALHMGQQKAIILGIGQHGGVVGGAPYYNLMWCTNRDRHQVALGPGAGEAW